MLYTIHLVVLIIKNTKNYFSTHLDYTYKSISSFLKLMKDIFLRLFSVCFFTFTIMFTQLYVDARIIIFRL